MKYKLFFFNGLAFLGALSNFSLALADVDVSNDPELCNAGETCTQLDNGNFRVEYTLASDDNYLADVIYATPARDFEVRAKFFREQPYADSSISGDYLERETKLRPDGSGYAAIHTYRKDPSSITTDNKDGMVREVGYIQYFDANKKPISAEIHQGGFGRFKDFTTQDGLEFKPATNSPESLTLIEYESENGLAQVRTITDTAEQVTVYNNTIDQTLSASAEENININLVKYKRDIGPLGQYGNDAARELSINLRSELGGHDIFGLSLMPNDIQDLRLNLFDQPIRHEIIRGDEVESRSSQQFIDGKKQVEIKDDLGRVSYSATYAQDGTIETQQVYEYDNPISPIGKRIQEKDFVNKKLRIYEINSDNVYADYSSYSQSCFTSQPCHQVTEYFDASGEKISEQYVRDRGSDTDESIESDEENNPAKPNLIISSYYQDGQLSRIEQKVGLELESGGRYGVFTTQVNTINFKDGQTQISSSEIDPFTGLQISQSSQTFDVEKPLNSFVEAAETSDVAEIVDDLFTLGDRQQSVEAIEEYYLIADEGQSVDDVDEIFDIYTNSAENLDLKILDVNDFSEEDSAAAALSQASSMKVTKHLSSGSTGDLEVVDYTISHLRGETLQEKHYIKGQPEGVAEEVELARDVTKDFYIANERTTAYHKNSSGFDGTIRSITQADLLNECINKRGGQVCIYPVRVTNSLFDAQGKLVGLFETEDSFPEVKKVDYDAGYTDQVIGAPVDQMWDKVTTYDYSNDLATRQANVITLRSQTLMGFMNNNLPRPKTM